MMTNPYTQEREDWRMLPPEPSKRLRKRAAGLKSVIKHKPHVQKRYFSLMLVPSYSHGKTRSLKIPYALFYFILITAILIAAVISGLTLQARFFRQVAQDLNEEVEQAQEAYIGLQETADQIHAQLIDEIIQQNSFITQQQISAQEEKFLQQQTFEEALQSIFEQILEMERQIDEFDQLRRRVIDQLGARNYIPPVNTLLTALNREQAAMLTTVSLLNVTSDERSGARYADVPDIWDYFLILTAKLEAQAALNANLERHMPRIMTYIRNYPTHNPLPGRSLGSGFGRRMDPMGGGDMQQHNGVDIGAPQGTSIYATGGGTVIRSERAGDFGLLVVIDHGTINGVNIHTYYAHNSQNLVTVGQRVERGDVIARVGSTGRSTGPHVHYEVRINGRPVNPAPYIIKHQF
jgi:murein DD-endopeptidase MepM/ murein hydrolase activator NlpD